MAKNIDNAASRDAARQAQKVSQAEQARTGKQAMGIGAQPSQSQFGQILQEQMGQSAQLNRQDSVKPREDKPEDRRSDTRDSGKGKESAHKDAAVQDRVRESKGRDDSRDRSDSREDSKGGGERKESTQQAKEAEQRVVGKQQGRGDGEGQKGGQQGKGQDGRHGAGQQSQGEAGTMAGKTAKQPAQSQAKPQFAQGAMATAQASSTSAAAKSAPMTRIPQQVIDQIVSYARLHSKKDGETEMELALHEEVFKGLRMRISTKNGKITTTFITSSRDVKDLFNTHKQTLRRQLTENGLALEGIDVIMT